MLKPNAKAQERAQKFAKLAAKQKRHRERLGPTAFNPHFHIVATAVADPRLSVEGGGGPQMKTQQWIPTARRQESPKKAA